MTYTLILETSTERGVVALAEDDKLLFTEELPFGMRSSNFLMSTIQKSFTETGLSAAHLHAVAVGVGPGLFTGMRVAASMAKGLALARSLPLISLSSLSGFISQEEGKFASVIDARMGGAYLLLQENKGGQIIECAPAMLVPQKELILKLARISHQHSSRFGQTVFPDDKERPEGRVKLTLSRGYLKSDGETDGQIDSSVGEKYGLEGCTAIVGPSFEKLILPSATECAPDAAHLAKIAYKRFITGEHYSPETLTLNYLRE